MRIPNIRRRLLLNEIEATFDLYMILAELNRIEAIEPEEYSQNVIKMATQGINAVMPMYEKHCEDLFKNTGINPMDLINDSSIAEYYDDFEGFKRAILSLYKR